MNNRLKLWGVQLHKSHVHETVSCILLICIYFSEHCSLSAVVSEAFVRFFVEIVGHYSLFMGGSERDEESSASSSSPTPLSFQREAFRKAVSSKSLRRFLEVFMETQMFAAFIQEREIRRQGLRGILGAH